MIRDRNAAKEMVCRRNQRDGMSADQTGLIVSLMEVI